MTTQGAKILLRSPIPTLLLSERTQAVSYSQTAWHLLKEASVQYLNSDSCFSA